VREINKAKKAIRTAFEAQLAGEGLALVEILSSCPTNNHTTAVEALQWIEEAMVPYFPLGDYKVSDVVQQLSTKG
jgi:2-oxoglutarate ferredoxin oxidoreductase subunit beta